jgi:hypothetical protein
MAFAEARVVVTDELCNGKPRLVGKNGDGTPGTLDPGDRWTYQCDVQTTPNQTRLDNVATVDGTDRNGRKVSARDTLTTTLNRQQILPTTASARLRGPAGCPVRPTWAYVTGQSISRVVFYVDGKRRATVRRADARGWWKLRIVPKKMRYGRHSVRAVVFFASGSTRSARPSKLTMKLTRCRPNRTPKFTG